MSGSSKKTALIIIGAVVVLAAAGLGIGVPMFEQRQAKMVEDYLATLPGELKAQKVTVGLWDKAVTLEKFSGKYTFKEIGSTSSFVIDKLVVKGVNLSAGTQKGVIPLADSVEATRSVNEGAGMLPPEGGMPGNFSGIVTIDSWKMTGLRGDWLGLLDGLREGEPKFAWFKPACTLSAATTEMGKYVGEIKYPGIGKEIGFSIDSVSAKDVSMLKMGPAEFKNIKATLAKAPVFSLDSWSIRSLISPDVMTASTAFLQDKNEAMFLEGMKKAIAAQPYVLDGMRLAGMSVTPPGMEAVTLKSLDFSLTVGLDKVIVDKKLEDLALPAAYLELGGSELKEFAGAYARPLHISTEAKGRLVKKKEGNAEFVLDGFSLSDPGLGAFSCAFDTAVLLGDQPLFTALDGDAPVEVASASARFEDKGVVNLSYDVQARMLRRMFPEPPEGLTAAGMKENHLRQLREAVLTTPSPAMREMIEGAIALLEKSGSLAVEVRPEKPMNAELLGQALVLNPQSVNLKVTYTPPAGQPAAPAAN